MKSFLCKFVSFLLSFFFLLQSAVPVLAIESNLPPYFSDVQGIWDYKIDAGRENGILYGTGYRRFFPGRVVTLAESITFLGRVYEKLSGETLEEKDSFADIDPGRFYSRYAVWAREKGLLGPFFQKTFQPEHLMTREDTAILLYRFLLLFDTAEMIDMKNAFHYMDEEEFSTEGQAAVYTLSAIPLIRYDRCDYDKKWLNPARLVRRWEMGEYVVDLYRLLLPGQRLYYFE